MDWVLIKQEGAVTGPGGIHAIKKGSGFLEPTPLYRGDQQQFRLQGGYGVSGSESDATSRLVLTDEA